MSVVSSIVDHSESFSMKDDEPFLSLIPKRDPFTLILKVSSANVKANAKLSKPHLEFGAASTMSGGNRSVDSEGLPATQPVFLLNGCYSNVNWIMTALLSNNFI